MPRIWRNSSPAIRRISSSCSCRISSSRDPPKKQRIKARSSGARWGNLLCTKVAASSRLPSLRGTRKPKPGGSDDRTLWPQPSVTVMEEVYWMTRSSLASSVGTDCKIAAAAWAGVAIIRESKSSGAPAPDAETIQPSSLNLNCCTVVLKQIEEAHRRAASAFVICCIPSLSDVNSGRGEPLDA